MLEFKQWQSVTTSYNKEKLSASVWGRDMVFDKSVFPTSIKIQGKEILHSPITLTAEFDNGFIGKWDNHHIIQTKKTDEQVCYSIAQSSENMILNANLTIEFDGFIKVDLSIIPFWAVDFCEYKGNKPRLTKLYIDIPIKKENSTLLHFWPNCESAVNLSHTVLNSLSTPEGKTIFPFKAYMWTGWENGGFGICCESDKGFELENKEQCITVTSDEEKTNIHIALLDNMPTAWQGVVDTWADNLDVIKFSFGIQATPVKEFDTKNLQEWRAFHLYDVMKHPIFDKVTGDGTTLLEKISKSGAKWLILHEDWSVIQNYGLVDDEEDFKRFVNDCHKLGMKLMVYFGYEVSSLYPGFNDVYDEYLNKNLNGKTVGGWQRLPMQRDYTVCYNSKYSDVMIDRVKYVMDEYGVDGIYTDGTYVPWECANEKHGCGYRDENGILHYAYPIYKVREHVKKLFQTVHERGGIVDTHQSACCLTPTLAFADSYFDGENIQELITDDIRNLKMDTFRAEFMGTPIGLPINFISYTGEKFIMEQIAGISLLHNVYPRANKISDLDFTSKIWEIYDKFDTSNSLWYPYWEEQEIKLENENSYLSYYKNNDKLLLIITSYDENNNTINIKLDKKYQTATDVLNNKTYSINGENLCVDFEFSNVKILEVK